MKLAAETFVEEHANLVLGVRQAVERKDAEMLKIKAHSLKGALRYFGPTNATELAARLEQCGAAGSLEDSSEILDALERAVPWSSRTSAVTSPRARRRTWCIHGHLPSGLPAVSIAAAGHVMLAIDNAGTLFLRDDSGSAWEPVTKQWTGRAVTVRRQAPGSVSAGSRRRLPLKRKRRGVPQLTLVLRPRRPQSLKF